MVGDDVIKDFRSFLASRNFKYDAEAFDGSRKSLELRLRSRIGGVKWGVEAEMTTDKEDEVLSRRDKDGKGAKATDLKAAVPAS